VSSDTVVEPVLGSGIADYGGADNTIISNVVADTHAYGSGIEVASPTPGSAGQSPLGGTITVADNTVLRSGSSRTLTGIPSGAVAVDSSASPITDADISFTSNRIDDSPYGAIEIGTTGAKGTSQPVTGVIFDGDTISGTGTVAVQAEAGGSGSFSNVTGTGIGVPGIFQAAQPAGKPGFAIRLGPGDVGWSITPVLTTYPRHGQPVSALPTPSPTPSAASPSPSARPSLTQTPSPAPAAPQSASSAAPPPPAPAPAPQPTAEPSNNFSIALASEADGLCLDADGSQQYAYGSFLQWSCDSSDPFQEFWVTYASSTNYYEVEDEGDNLCLDADAQQDYAGGAIIQWPCNPDDPYQEWQAIPLQMSSSVIFYAFMNAGAGLCLDFDGDEAWQGGAVIQWSCDYASGDLYTMFNVSSL
jgi:hypothetical protein